MELLLLSNSRNHGQGFLQHARHELRSFAPDRIAFVPYALADHDGYTGTVAAALEPLGIEVTGVHTASDPRSPLRTAEAVFVGGGNSFRLLRAMQRTDLLQVIRDRVRDGSLRYVGSSAGTNLAAPTIRTTNDMPITQPVSFDALGLVPFQINPHYLDPSPTSTHMGETREQRLGEFLEENDVPVLGIREGGWLRVSGDRACLGGANGGRLFRRGVDATELAADADVSFLLESEPRFDQSG